MFLAALVLFLAGCASVVSTTSVLPDTEISVAASETMPSQIHPLWRPVGRGVSAFMGLHETYWVRVRPRHEQANWQVFGPFRQGDVVAIREQPGDAPQYLSFSSDAQSLAGRPPQQPVGSVSYFHIGHPPKVKTTGVHAGPKTEITVGAGGSKPPGPPSAALRAGLQPDQHNPSDPQEVFCRNPVRAYNDEPFAVRVSWTQHFVAEGPGCQGQGDSNEVADLTPGARQRRFCGLQTSPASACRVTTTYRPADVKVQRLE